MREVDSMSKDDGFLTRIAAAVDNAGDKVALKDVTRSITYQELWESSGRVAGVLATKGVQTGDRVVVFCDKRIETVIVLLAALRAGAAFVPVDEKAPPARVALLLADAAPTVVVGPTAADQATTAHVPDARGMAGSSDVAYCMYTSGSTGAPKGVQVTHGAIAAFIDAVGATARVQASSRCLNTAPFFFDASVIDVWYPLAVGATVFLAPSLLAPDRILDLVEHERITHLAAVAGVLGLLRRARSPLAARDLSSVSRVLTGADVVDPVIVGEWLAATPSTTIVNGYGPTEATCCCLAHEITPDNSDDVPYPIGRPFPGVETLVVDADREPCPPGRVGELLLGGPQLAAGYLGRPDETDARFVLRDGRRWYRTGDLVTEDAGGIFRFKGRADHEMKVRGYRIHPAEVVTALQQCEGVGEAHVTVATDERGERVLVAAVAPLDAVELVASDLRAHLRARLPDYMVPRRITVVSTLPKLPSGKVDDRAVAAGAHE